ncbi:MAG TPA: DUF4215 domain-containing protein [Kofleriaceae bacterium]|nr:DUF4215 domain-containing protein [Kofleriaceae bacterium]
MRNHLLHTVFVMLASMVVAACHTVSPDITHCPDVDCPQEKVCDNHGGCAFPEQLQICSGKADGTTCTYRDPTGASVAGQCAGSVCYPLGCGNKFVTPDEVCDDGNNESGDGCAADCRSDETCGNSVVDTAAGEQCDDGNMVDGDGCQSTCKQARCGDGVKDTSLDEECDAGDSNSMNPDAACRPTCVLPRCGDGVLDVMHGEVCDDGGNQAGDGCAGDCKSTEVCGNGVVDSLAGEICDDGNTASGDGCAGDCLSLEVCGNNVLDTARGEICDDGNTVSGDGCSSDCKSLEVCGNMIVDAVTEQCDLGSMNSNAPDAMCRTSCKLPRCGDTIIDPMHGEACDNGLMNADAPNACRTNCQNPRCGDNIRDSGEVCDDGNTTSGDGCSANCGSLETCGNGIIDTAKGEQCDAGAANSNSPNAACRTDCKLRKCGDTVIDNTFGEACDQGINNSDNPNATCRTNCTLQRCGDGVFDNTKGEACDDGNVVSGDGCSNDCRSLEVCGNSIVDTIKGEQCDAGAANANTPNAPCRTTCVLPRCGDSVVDNTLLGEGCDMGAANSNSANAACRTNCQPRRCGDGVLDNLSGEVCDDGNVISGDGCSADCTSLETCGNGVVDTAKGEQCDAGANNSNSPNAACRTDCKLQRCGDTVLDNLFGEGCDLGPANSNAPNATCRTNCLPQRCGDTITDNTKGEVCDDGNLVSGDNCSADCKSNETCGNGIVDVAKNEQCDAGALNSNAPNAACRTTCQRQRCGDNVIDNAFGEGCDAGAANSNSPNAACRLNCTPRRCGDGIIDSASGEVCDDANNTNGDGCSSDCKSLETCGNGVVDAIKGEQCDAGAANSNAPNAACRTDCKVQRCGDGIADNTKGEQCDAGAANSNAPNAACRPTCLLPKCGDGVLDNMRGEVCDDNNTVSNDGCRSDCASNETCGNGVLDSHVGELCDDGNLRGFDGCSKCTPETAVVLSPAASPPARSLQVLAYDAARQRVVMFGGHSGTTTFGDTWEWDGISWTQLFPAHSPPGRYDAAAAYDPKRHRVVLFGGTTLATGAATQDTWEWDGIDWTQRSPATVPSGRSGAAMAFHPTRGNLVMFGGTNGVTPNNETWEWTGSNWAVVSPSGPPGARAGARMAIDPINKYVVMFGGTADTNTYTLSFNTTTSVWSWATIATGAGPTTGYAAVGMAFDTERAKVTLWGGVNNNTYTWSGATWTLVTGTTPTSPRGEITMTYDIARKQIVLFGGVNGTTPYSDTWLRDTVWAVPAAFVKPTTRFRTQPGYDPLRKRLVVLSGQKENQRFYALADPVQYQDVWEWDGRRWVTGVTTNQPSARAGSHLEFDVNNRVMRVYGGDYRKINNPGQADTWMSSDMFNFTGTTWTSLSTSGRSDRVQQLGSAWDQSVNKLVTWGGYGLDAMNNFFHYDTTWTWSPTTGWANVSGSPRPPGRRNFTLAYDRVRQRTVLFGGTNDNYLTDTWEFNASTNTWANKTPAISPAPRAGAQLFFNADSGHVTLFGSSPYNDTEDLWDWNGTAWTEMPLIGTLVPTYSRIVGYDNASHAIVTFGGRDVSAFLATDVFALVKNRPNGSVEACTDSKIDYDNDGNAGCADDECWPQCDPLKSPGTARPSGAPFCGDGTCNGPEDCLICPNDCTTGCTIKCGDFHCDGTEASTCPSDC